MCELCWMLFPLLLTNFLLFLSAFLPVTMATVTRLPTRPSAFPLDSALSVSEKVLYVSWSTNWSGLCLGLPAKLAVVMKLLNEAERGHLCSDPDDHACRWHGETGCHLGANYIDFTPARV